MIQVGNLVFETAETQMFHDIKLMETMEDGIFIIGTALPNG